MPLTVSTSCPSCGGALDFEQGTNAVHCPYCDSNHIVTGHGRVLSYYVPEKIPPDRAVALSLLKLKEEGDNGWRAKEATLFFVPFYHFVGQVLRWEAEEAAGEDEGGTVSAGQSGYAAGERIMEALTGGTGIGAARLYEKRFELFSGLIDRSLPALDATRLKVYSLGLRPEVLKLSLFEQKVVSSRGRLAPVKLTAPEVEEAGYAPAFGEKSFSRKVFARTTSVIYFPFWAVEVAGAGGEGFLSIVDGISGEVPNPKAPIALLDDLLDKGGATFEVVGFRPLKCPECAADLPVRPKDVVFFCSNCKKAWYIVGDGLTEVPYSVLPPRQKGASPALYFPFWVVRAKLSTGKRVVENKYDLIKLAPGTSIAREEDRQVPLRFFVPAFRIGNLKVLSRLASTFTRSQPVWERGGECGPPARGSFLSPDDALTLAPLITFSLVPKYNKISVAFAFEATVEAIEAELVLVPFFRDRNDYVDGLFGQSLPSGSLKD